MSQEETKVQPATGETRDKQSERKPWVAPIVSDSPVNDLTAAATGAVADGGLYS